MAALPDRASQERQLALLVASALDYAIFMLDPQGHVTTWNAGAERIHGYVADEVLGRHFSLFHTPEDAARDHPAQELRRAIEDGRYEEEGWRVRKDGTPFWANVTITPLYDEGGELVGFGKVSRELTARRRQEEEDRARTQQLDEYRRVISSVRDYAIFMLDAGGHIRTWNAGAERLKGYAPEDIIGRHFSVFYTEEDRARDHPANELEIAIREGRYEEEGWRVRKDGTLFWAGVTITAVQDDAGGLTGFAKVTRDLTARRETELALQQAVEDLRRVNAELDRFAAIAAHDLTDPLRTISGFAELLERSDLPAAERSFAAHIRASAVRLTRMLHGLLTYARAGRPEEERGPCDLAAAAEDVLADLGASIAERGAQVTVELPPGASVLATPGDVRTVLQNLVSNAVKFADPDDPCVHVTAEPAGADVLRVMVEDNGPGVAPEDRTRVFGAFERGVAGEGEIGYGLGLAICTRLADRHGGELGVDPAPGGGSRFWITLPSAI